MLQQSTTFRFTIFNTPINKIVVEFASKTIMELSVYCHVSPKMNFGTQMCQKNNKLMFAKNFFILVMLFFIYTGTFPKVVTFNGVIHKLPWVHPEVGPNFETLDPPPPLGTPPLGTQITTINFVEFFIKKKY